MSLENTEHEEIKEPGKEPEKKKHQANCSRHKHRSSVSHSQETSSDYENMKVYPVSNKASRERLKKKIRESKSKDSVLINWDVIMA